MNSFNLLVIPITYFLTAMATNLNSSMCLDRIKQKDAYLNLTTAIGIIEPVKEKSIRTSQIMETSCKTSKRNV